MKAIRTALSATVLAAALAAWALFPPGPPALAKSRKADTDKTLKKTRVEVLTDWDERNLYRLVRINGVTCIEYKSLRRGGLSCDWSRAPKF
ncbi:hypothetical protein G3N55_02930 [Dissulfurirhabdus thermomarina]|uniref:Uncharacterized protein n=1 Tax=Dissulfurirhabdus thermomarina TaxID=1765737 RepID=A0A6N9TL68_DISTH|nr:hypothetical protein [Dissulfurirhabdus thermomarina]NDY41808.1 hypothetical protein [Dissulfurirhabdus thermomarina]NMX24051.1 hypothetical protein [Dissulfurirhabdus thermomarina]